MPKKADMEIFELFHFEDDLFFNKDYKEKWLIDIWNGDLEWNKLPHHVLKKRKKGEKNFRYADEKDEIITASLEKKDTHSNKNSVDVVPYRIPLDPPKGLFTKIKYFKNNDHILLKRYMEQKGGLENKLFEKTYGLFLDIKHKLKNQNSVGNLRSHYTLSKEGKILYNATSSYGLLCCIVHKLTFYPQDKADLMLSTWRSDKYEAVVRTGFFENDIKWSDMKYRSYSYAMDSYVRNATEMEKLEQEYRFFGVYEKLLTMNIPDYKKIVVVGNSMPFGDFLERNEIAYSIIEDGAGLFCDYSLLQHSIDSTYPLIEQYMNKKYSNLYGGKFCEKIYINVKAQKKEYNDARTIDFAPVTLIDSLSNTNRKKILSIYGVDEASSINNKRVCLLLTYPLAQREKFTINEEKQCYSLLADMFGADCDEVHLKAHPDDRTDFSEIEGIKIINRNVLSELLWYETKTQYVKAIATVSTSMNNLLCVDKGIVFDVTFWRLLA